MHDAAALLIALIFLIVSFFVALIAPPKANASYFGFLFGFWCFSQTGL